MRIIINIIIRMTLGFFLCACGTVMFLNSNLGLNPWNVFHQGLSNATFLTLGTANIVVGLVIVVIVSALGIKVGIGTIANMVVIGCFIDLIIYLKIIPTFTTIYGRIFIMIIGMFVSAVGSYLYISCEMGCGPRDGLMIALVKITGKSVSTVRCTLEIGALVIGWLLGGFIGIGTLITAFLVGYFTQIVYKIFDFDVKSLNHRNIKQGFIFIRKCLISKTV